MASRPASSQLGGPYPPKWPTQGPSQSKPYALASDEVDGSEKPRTWIDTATCAVPPALVTVTEPAYMPGICPLGTWSSSQNPCVCPAATAAGNALRVSPKNSSTLGMSGSGHRPVRPAALDVVVMV